MARGSILQNEQGQFHSSLAIGVIPLDSLKFIMTAIERAGSQESRTASLVHHLLKSDIDRA